MFTLYDVFCFFLNANKHYLYDGVIRSVSKLMIKDTGSGTKLADV